MNSRELFEETRVRALRIRKRNSSIVRGWIWASSNISLSSSDIFLSALLEAKNFFEKNLIWKWLSKNWKLPLKNTHTHTHTPKMRAQSFPWNRYKKKNIVLGWLCQNLFESALPCLPSTKELPLDWRLLNCIDTQEKWKNIWLWKKKWPSRL